MDDFRLQGATVRWVIGGWVVDLVEPKRELTALVVDPEHNYSIWEAVEAGVNKAADWEDHEAKERERYRNAGKTRP